MVWCTESMEISIMVSLREALALSLGLASTPSSSTFFTRGSLFRFDAVTYSFSLCAL